MTPNSPVSRRIGVVGCGKIGQKHLAAYYKLGITDLVAYDVSRDAAVAQTRSYSYQVAASLDEILLLPDVDGISICTPTPYHAEVAIAALRAGKHVFSEKPLCLTAQEAEQIKDAQQASGKVLMVGYLYRFLPAMQMVKEVIESDVIGDIHMAMLRVGGRGGHVAWKHSINDGGGALLEMLVHQLDLLCWWFKDVDVVSVPVFETLLKERPGAQGTLHVDAEDCIMARLSADGALVLCEGDLVSPSYMHYCELHGSNGSVFASILQVLPSIVFCKEARGGYGQGMNVRNYPVVDGHEEELKLFLEAMASGKNHGASDIEDSLRVMKLVDRIRALRAA